MFSVKCIPLVICMVAICSRRIFTPPTRTIVRLALVLCVYICCLLDTEQPTSLCLNVVPVYHYQIAWGTKTSLRFLRRHSVTDMTWLMWIKLARICSTSCLRRFILFSLNQLICSSPLHHRNTCASSTFSRFTIFNQKRRLVDMVVSKPIYVFENVLPTHSGPTCTSHWRNA